MIMTPGGAHQILGGTPAGGPECNLCSEPARFLIDGKVPACFSHLAGQVAVFRRPVVVSPVTAPPPPGSR